MGLKSTFKKSFVTGLSPKRWLGTDTIKQDSKTLVKIFKNAFFNKNPKNSLKKESFEEVVKRLNLTDQNIQERIKSSTKLYYMMLGASIVVFFYGFYQWFHVRDFLGGMICMTLTALSLIYAFREHFNVFQMQQRRLGCSYRDWFKSTFKKAK